MQKFIKISVIVFAMLIKLTTNVSAASGVVSASANLRSNEKTSSFDYREAVLRQYLKGHNSPLAEHAGVFIELADKYEIDWRLVPAISGVESTFGKRIPYKSFNAYGWANGKYVFENWEESIEVVTKTLREKYYDKGADNIYSIARRYAPPSSTWGRNVKFFIEKIDPLGLPYTLEG